MGLSIERKVKRLIPNWLKLFIVKRSASMIGLLISYLLINRTITYKRFPFTSVNLSPYDKGRIFLETWEAAEIKFTRRLLKQGMFNVVELGSSIGVNYAFNRGRAKSWICIEPIPKNLQILKLIHKFYDQNDPIIEAAIDYSSANSVKMGDTKHESSRLVKNQNNDKTKTLTVKSTTFSEVVNSMNHEEPFVLITDIEGGEAPIFFKDERSLENCFAIVAELDDSEEYSISIQIKQLQNLGFKIIEQYGSNVFIFMR